jgi:phenylpropionate dioxygenase-like ring-hydroxylating dioxygenase large terminal subunit
MFDGFSAQWTPALFSSELHNKPVPAVIAGEKLVFWRGTDGKPAALLDRCPHRSVALSLGEVDPQGCLRCPFHGWSFRSDGACTHVPYNPEINRVGLGAAAVPVHEAGGLVWVYTEVGATDPGSPDVPEGLSRPGASRGQASALWKTHWTRAMENMLDSPHLPFVHRNSIGGERYGVAKGMRSGKEMTFSLTEQPNGYRSVAMVGGEGDPGAWLEWHRPNAMVLNIPAGKMFFRQHVWCVPAGPGETRMMLLSVRDLHPAVNWLLSLMDPSERKVLEEDQRVLESTVPGEVPEPGEERSVPTDKPTLIFRRWYLRNLRDKISSAA